METLQTSETPSNVSADRTFGNVPLSAQSAALASAPQSAPPVPEPQSTPPVPEFATTSSNSQDSSGSAAPAAAAPEPPPPGRTGLTADVAALAPPAKRPRVATSRPTLCITHAQCAKHVTPEYSPEQPARVAHVMRAIHELEAASAAAEAPALQIVELETSAAMLQTLDAKLFPAGKPVAAVGGGGGGGAADCGKCAHCLDKPKFGGPGIKRKGCLQPVKAPAAAAAAASMPPPASPSAPPPELARTASVVYLETSILPAVRACHTATYLERLRTACEQMHTRALKRPRNPGPLARNLSGVAGRAGRVEGDTFASASSYSAALCAALAACKAVDAVCRGDAANAFAAIRPPGHHCGRDGSTAGPASFAGPALHFAAAASAAAGAAVADDDDAPRQEAPDSPASSSSAGADGDRCGQGFCLLNNAAIAAKHALLVHAKLVKRVAIVDIDLHHGNGTEEIVRPWPEVLYASIHGVGEAFYPETATTLQKEPTVVNVPLERDSPADKYHAAVDDHVVPALREFAPDLLIVSCGFDAHRDDSPTLDGFLRLSAEDYAAVTRRLAAVAAERCGGRLVSLLEGGYNLTALRACATAHVRELSLSASLL